MYLSFIHGFIVRRGVAPSFQEIGAHFGTTPPSVNNMIKTLDQRGLISRVRGAARTLRVLVPIAELPGSDFGSGTSCSKPSRGDGGAGERTVSAVVGATAAAIAVLDAVMPHVWSLSVWRSRPHGPSTIPCPGSGSGGLGRRRSRGAWRPNPLDGRLAGAAS
jgi:repressor LexA